MPDLKLENDEHLAEIALSQVDDLYKAVLQRLPRETRPHGAEGE